MARTARTCMTTLLKVVNAIMGVVGIAMIIYGFWMIGVFQRDMEDSTVIDPWFINTFLVTGVTLCFITCVGHIAADSAHGFCLSCYKVMIICLLLVETAMAADLLLNSDWEKDLPDDPTGNFRDFKEFVKSNFGIFKWIVLVILLSQGVSILLAMTLRALGSNQRSKYDSDDEYTLPRLPFLEPPPYVVSDPYLASKNGAWNVRIDSQLS
ncbi:hypothetical protein HS088_TW21G00820 [Tripterygium wilfordii]|uniref:Tetraspanin-19-like n=1 Tax=Tripterygium wilfordii TaxID=458696 RepID=A0A7J7C3I2_TRIWF|nr:tetraspanin-19-like [Tripterygium wilfordii]KAF5728671.1 hypothetical protein HS088_TW21G00820 [Tripterygium wilfordii]